jgi:hypothetical protein
MILLSKELLWFQLDLFHLQGLEFPVNLFIEFLAVFDIRNFDFKVRLSSF